MKILELRAENIKNIKVVEIKPGDGAVMLTGKNEAGKSAILDAIFMGLTGKRIDEPIRNGEKRAEINIDLGDYKVKRIFTEKTDRLEVLSKEGAKFPSPQGMLDRILGKLSFDPLKFAMIDEMEQRKILAGLVGLDFSSEDSLRKDYYDARTAKNRDEKAILNQIDDMPPVNKDTPRQEISMSEEISKVEALEQSAKKYKDFQAELQAIERDIANNNMAIKNSKEEIENLKEQIQALESGIKDLENKNMDLASLKVSAKGPMEVTDDQIASARTALRGIEQKNIAIRNAIKYDEKIVELNKVQDEIAALEKKMADIDMEKESKIQAAKYPIKDLGLGVNYVIYKGKPFSQLSTGTQWRVSTAIAMALNPTLKIILIREGSLLDTEGMKAIVDLAKEKDYQLWIEKVADSKGVGIYIEDGEIK